MPNNNNTDQIETDDVIFTGELSEENNATDCEDASDVSDNLMSRYDESCGMFEDSAYFVSRLRSHPSLPLATSLEIVEMCSELVGSIVSRLHQEIGTIFSECGIEHEERPRKLLEIVKIFEESILWS